MPLFGGGKRQAENEALHAELERLSTLSLRDLAAEVMIKGFGPGGPAADGPVHIQNVAGAFSPVTGVLAQRQSRHDGASCICSCLAGLRHRAPFHEPHIGARIAELDADPAPLCDTAGRP